MEPFADGRATETEGLDLSAARTHSCADVITNRYGHYYLVFGRGARRAQEWRGAAQFSSLVVAKPFEIFDCAFHHGFP